MAVTKLWVVKDRLDKVIKYSENHEKTDADLKYTREDYQSLKDVLEYAENEEKTEKQFFVSGINCNPNKAREQFVAVKEKYDKSDGIQAYHGYMSFKENEITPELAHEIGIEFAKRVWGERFQVIVTTHLNTKHLHNHFVINSVSFIDGKRLHGEEKAWFKFKDIADEICKEYKISVIQNPNRNPEPDYLTMKDKAGMPTRYNLVREAIDEAIKNSSNMREFQHHLYEMGYKYDLSPNHKYWTVTPKGWKKPIRLYRLGDEYTNIKIRQQVSQQKNAFHKPTKLTYQVPEYNEQYDIRKVKGSLYNLYLYYCYRLGYFDKPEEKKNPNRLHYILKEELMKADIYSKEAQLLGKNHIDTARQLLLYKESVEREIAILSDSRKRLRNKIRQKSTSEAEVSACKEEISLISQRLKELRKEVELCDDIGQRSHIIENNVKCIVKDDEKIISKEEKEYE